VSEYNATGSDAEAVHGLKCADLVDAMGRLHRHRCHILDLVTPTPGRVLFGSAVTISYFPSCSATLDPERYNLANSRSTGARSPCRPARRRPLRRTFA
jgi:hypothetical protein